MLPTKNRRSSPASVSCSSRALARRVERNPATSLADSRSRILITPSSDSRWRSRSCTTSPALLFPAIEHLLATAAGLLVALPDLRFNRGAASGPLDPAAVVQIGVVRIGLRHYRHQRFNGAKRPALDHHVPLGQVLEGFSQMLSAVQRRSHFVGVAAGKLKKYVSAHGHDGGAHLRRILFEKLVGGDNRDAEFAGF